MHAANIRPEDRAALEAALSRLGLDLDEDAKSNLLLYLYFLIEKNRTVNLTSITDMSEAIVLHLEDTLAILSEVHLSSGALCDIGSGGGVPGVPLSIVTGRNAVLLESVKKKSRAVGEIVEGLGYSEQISCIPQRSEEFTETHGERFSLVTTRAVATLSSVMELASPLLSQGGYFVAMCGDADENERIARSPLCEKFGYSFHSSRTFSIGNRGSEHSRSVFVFTRDFQPSVTLPRRPGMATKRPYR